MRRKALPGTMTRQAKFRCPSPYRLEGPESNGLTLSGLSDEELVGLQLVFWELCHEVADI